jgi:hypothetical protein
VHWFAGVLQSLCSSGFWRQAISPTPSALASSFRWRAGYGCLAALPQPEERELRWARLNAGYMLRLAIRR